MLVFFLGKMCSDRRKNHGCGKKKGTSSAIFGVGTAAQCYQLNRCANRVRSRTDNKDEVLEGKFRNLNFSPSTKTTTEYSFKPFFHLFDIFSQVLNFTSLELSRFAKQAKHLKTLFFKKDGGHTNLAKKNADCLKAWRDFPPRKDGILHPPSGCLGTPLPLPQSLYWRGRTYADVTTKFLGSIGYQICLAMVLHWRVTHAGFAIMNYLIMGCLSFPPYATRT